MRILKFSFLIFLFTILIQKNYSLYIVLVLDFFHEYQLQLQIMYNTFLVYYCTCIVQLYTLYLDSYPMKSPPYTISIYVKVYTIHKAFIFLRGNLKQTKIPLQFPLLQLLYLKLFFLHPFQIHQDFQQLHSLYP